MGDTTRIVVKDGRQSHHPVLRNFRPPKSTKDILATLGDSEGFLASGPDIEQADTLIGDDALDAGIYFYFKTPATAAAAGLGSAATAEGNPAQQLTKYLMPPQLTELPNLPAVQNRFTNLETSDRKVPVSHRVYGVFATQPDVCSLLVAVDPSPLTTVTDFLLESLVTPQQSAAESDTTTLVQIFYNHLFHIFGKHWAGLSYEALYNRVEAGTSIPATVKNTRLDTLLVSRDKLVAIYFGEEKRHGLMLDAEQDLEDKLVELPLQYMGVQQDDQHIDVPSYHLTHTAAGVQFQLQAVEFHGEQVQLVPLGDVMDMSKSQGVAMMILSLAQLYAVLTVINKKLPRLDVTFPHGRVYTRKFDASGEKWIREVEFGYVSAVKTISGFTSFCNFHHTKAAQILKAYEGVDELKVPDGYGQFMASGTGGMMEESKKRKNTEGGGTSRSGAQNKDRFRVTLRPVGYSKHPRTEQEIKEVALACCLTKLKLQGQKLVYKDWRQENIVKHCKRKGYMVVDFESVSRENVEYDDQDFEDHRLQTWDRHTLEGGKFTHASDMLQLGRLIQRYMTPSVQVSDEGREWVGKLTCLDHASRMTVDDALGHTWLENDAAPWLK